MTPSSKSLVLALGLMIGALNPAAAFDIDAMSDAERAAFRAEIRAYLLDKPEVLMEAFDILDERQAAAEAQAESQIIAANSNAIFASPYD